MNWEPTNGTEAISSWLNQGVLFGLVLATAMVIGCAVLWAVGSLAGNGQAASRGRAGIGLSLAAALLLGAGFAYLQWTSSTQAVAFAGDPAQYGINDTPQIPGAWEVIDLSERWTGNINAFRAQQRSPTATPPTAHSPQERRRAREAVLVKVVNVRARRLVRTASTQRSAPGTTALANWTSSTVTSPRHSSETPIPGAVSARR